METSFQFNNLGSLFEYIARKNDSLKALLYPDGSSIKYNELNNLANQIANSFLVLKIHQGSVVLLSGDKSIMMFASILAALKAGVTYSVYDPEGPTDRLYRIVMSCKPALIVNSIHDFTRLEQIKGIQSLTYSKLEKLAIFQDSNNYQKTIVNANEIAYIMFTSGSTGIPKGASITHANIFYLIEWSVKTFDFGPGEILTNINPSYFDNFVFDLFSSIFSGATLVPFGKEHVTNPRKLIEYIDILGCTSWFSVPTMLMYLQNMRVLNSNNMLSIRRFIFGGEGYPKSKLINLYNLYKERTKFYNVYGPTECTCICSCYEVDQADFEFLDGFLPLGAMIPHFSYFIMNEEMKSVDVGEIGELYLLGPAVGKGYFNDSERTATAFILDASSYRSIMYRTGDLVKYNQIDGKIYIYGRVDNQIKHMGYRIELEEVENNLMKIPYIQQACCVHGIVKGLSQLIAVVSTSKETNIMEIIEYSKRFLPTYMIPNKFYLVHDLPKSANGKVDRLVLKTKYLQIA